MRAVTAIVLGLALALCCQMYILSQTIHYSGGDGDHRVLRHNDEASTLKARVADLLVAIQKRDERINMLQQDLADCRQRNEPKETIPNEQQPRYNSTDKHQFPPSMSSFLHGVSRIRKTEFMDTFDYGLPDVTDAEREAGQSEVLLLYNTEAAMPSTSNTFADGSFAGPLLSVQDATEKCETLNIVSIGDSKESSEMFVGSQCLALVGHEQMYHVQRFVKMNNDNFKLVQRETIKERKTGNYISQYKFDTEEDASSPARLHREFLTKYLPYVDTLKSRLKPVLESISVNNTVVVMVCNKDQSSLLHNFACACRAKGIQIDNVVIFPTDKETERLAQELGFATFYDEEVSKHSV